MTEIKKSYPTTPDEKGFFFANEEDERSGKASRQYPTPVDNDGFYFDSSEEEVMEILTKIYDNGNKVKRAVLPSSGKVAVVRELTGKDTKDVSRHSDGDPEKYQLAVICVAATLDGIRQPFDVFENLKMKDYNRLAIMCQALNF